MSPGRCRLSRHAEQPVHPGPEPAQGEQPAHRGEAEGVVAQLEAAVTAREDDLDELGHSGPEDEVDAGQGVLVHRGWFSRQVTGPFSLASPCGGVVDCRWAACGYLQPFL